jgi:magnesium-transporting ATPase (P-type)
VGFIVAMRIVTNIEMIARTMISSIRVKEEDLRIFLLLLLFFIIFLYVFLMVNIRYIIKGRLKKCKMEIYRRYV